MHTVPYHNDQVFISVYDDIPELKQFETAGQPLPPLLKRFASRSYRILEHNGTKVFTGMVAGAGCVSQSFGGPSAIPFWLGSTAVWGLSTYLSVEEVPPTMFANRMLPFVNSVFYFVAGLIPGALVALLAS